MYAYNQDDCSMRPRSRGPNTMTMQKPMLTADDFATCFVVPWGP
jgi:hypothetical protein